MPKSCMQDCMQCLLLGTMIDRRQVWGGASGPGTEACGPVTYLQVRLGFGGEQKGGLMVAY